jgi:predicted Zn finger-like uncharacterized protein
MDVRCDRCETEYELDDAIVTDAGTSVQCTTCGHTFIVTRRLTSPLSQMRLTPPPAVAEQAGPEVPEWTLSTDDGRIHRFRDLNTLQKWIVERKVTRTEKISRSGGPWLAVGDVVELGPFFSVVDEADLARASGGPARGMSPSAVRPGGFGPASPFMPFRPTAGERPISEDGPTSPNRRLPEIAQASMLAARTPAPVRVADAAVSAAPSSGPVPPGVDPRGSEDRFPTAARGELTGKRAAARSEIVVGPETTEEMEALEAQSLRPSRRGRNLILGVLAAVGAAGGGYWWWSQQQTGARAPTAPASLAGGGSPSTNTAATSTPAPANEPGGRAPGVVEPMRVGGASPGSPSATTAPSPDEANEKAIARAAPAGTSPSPSPSPYSAKPGEPAATAARAAPGASPVAAARGAVHPDAARAGSYDQLIAEADRLLERGKSAQADKLYAKALTVHPDGVAALTGAAYVLLDRQRHFRAIETFRRALAVQPTYGPALFGIAESYRARGDGVQALGAYRQYLAISPSGTDAPAARHQIKELESAPPERAAQDTPGANDDDR